MNLFSYRNNLIPKYLFSFTLGLVTGPLPDLFLFLIALIFILESFKK